ncbi:MAG: TspO/MBR family protein [Candidatus Nanohaloarchaea archaeon]
MEYGRRELFLLAGSLAVAFLAASLGGFFTAGSVSTWYPGLAKPWFTPPNWVFGPVWTVLYAMMGASLFLVVRESLERRPLAAFGTQLALNVAWSAAFFGLKSPALGLAVIALLLGAILWTVREFYRVSRASAYLLIPYLFWVVFAAFLNLAIYLMN